MTERKVKLDPQWLEPLEAEFCSAYMQQLSTFLRSEKESGKEIYPAGDNIFAALNSAPLNSVRVVILGQDPYHGPGQAHGLSFSVPSGIAIPPSLKNIYKELQSDLSLSLPPHGNLSAWAEQGVLLLNSVLTVERGLAASHQGKGWEQFTDRIIEVVNQQARPIVFLFWGAYAQKKGRIVSRDKHLVLHAPHPSPLSAHRGFLGCRHFSQANEFLIAQGRNPVDWQIR